MNKYVKNDIKEIKDNLKYAIEPNIEWKRRNDERDKKAILKKLDEITELLKGIQSELYFQRANKSEDDNPNPYINPNLIHFNTPTIDPKKFIVTICQDGTGDIKNE